MNSRLASKSFSASPAASADPSCALIQLEGVSKIFKTGAGEFTALQSIDLCFGEGDFVSIMGKSGSGKSTLVNMVTGIDHPTRGRVRVGDQDIHTLSEGRLAVWRGRTLGIVFQFFQLLPMLTALENTMLPMDLCNVYASAERESRARALLKKVGLGEEADKLPAALSGGQQQIAAIARALANDPPIIVADEPTGNLDSRSAERILEIFSDLAAQGKTILIVTHDPGLAQRATHRVLISDGELINEMVAQALPVLTHPQMLAVTKHMTPRSFSPGEMIFRTASIPGGMFILARGQVDVFRVARRGNPELAAVLQPGQAWGDLDLEQRRACELVFQAGAQGPVDVFWLKGEALHALLAGASPQEAALHQLLQERLRGLCSQAKGKG